MRGVKIFSVVGLKYRAAIYQATRREFRGADIDDFKFMKTNFFIELLPKRKSISIFVGACLLSQFGCASPDTMRDNLNENAPANTSAQPTPSAANETSSAPMNESSTASNEAQILYNKGVEAFANSQDQTALEAFQQAIALDPNYGDAYLKLGATYAVQGNRDEATKTYKLAVEAFEKLARANPKDAAPQFGLGLAQTKLGEHEDAVKAFKQAVKLDPEDAEKQYELGLSHEKLAQYKEAVAALNQAVKLAPEDFRASDALAKAKENLDRREAFLKYQEKLQEKQSPPKQIQSKETSAKNSQPKEPTLKQNQP